MLLNEPLHLNEVFSDVSDEIGFEEKHWSLLLQGSTKRALLVPAFSSSLFF